MNRHCASIALLALALSVFAGHRAQADPIATPSPSPTPSDPCGGSTRLLATANRPTVGFSACAVAKSTAVFELGYQNQVNGTIDGGSVQSQVPQNFLRFGVMPRFELDVIGPNYVATRSYRQNGASTVTHGVADSGLGFKYELPPTGNWIVGFDGLYTGPNGSPFLTAGSATLTGNVDAAYALSKSAGIGTTIAVSSTGGIENGERVQYGVVEPSVVLTKQTPDKFQFYAEYVFVSKIAPDAGGRAFTDFGIQKLLGTNVEVDVEYGHAFTGDPALRFDYIGSGLVLQLW